MTDLDFKHELISRIKRGDRKAQYEFYNQYARGMYNICYRMVSDDMEAEDILQQSFVKAFKHIDKFDFRATPGAWLKRIVVNNCINYLRKKKIDLVSIDNNHLHLTEEVENNDTSYNMDVVKKAMTKLPEGYKVVIQLYLIEGYDHSEIGQILGISDSTSKSQYHRAKKKLQLIVKEIMNNYE